jgi:subtilisin family serine protease
MRLSSGSERVAVALIDGTVAKDHPDLAEAHIHDIGGGSPDACTEFADSASAHATFVAGILVARRGSPAPAICPGCSLLVRPIFRETGAHDSLPEATPHVPEATPHELADAITDCVDAGAHIVNLSAATGAPSTRAERRLERSLDHAARRGVLIVAAAGNQGTLGSSSITRHPGVIPVAACDSSGHPLSHSNLGGSIGRRGLSAPGEAIESLRPSRGTLTLSGTSFAAAFVTGALALVWSQFPHASAAEVRRAMARRPGRRTIAPPLLDAWMAYEHMARTPHKMEIKAV